MDDPPTQEEYLDIGSHSTSFQHTIEDEPSPLHQSSELSAERSFEYPSSYNISDSECRQLQVKYCRVVSKYFSCASNVAHVPFLDEVTVIECDHSGREYYNNEHDITLRIPPGAIPEGQIVHFELAVALYGPFVFPDNERPISPILWLCPQEDITFKIPFEIILPHYLTGLSEEELQSCGVGFIKASHNEYITSEYGQRLYQFKHVVGTQNFHSDSDTGQSYGVLKTSHCCYICIKENRCHSHALSVGFCLNCIQPCTPTPLREEVYFCVTFCLPSCIKALEQQFPPEKYKITTTEFKFQDGGGDTQLSLSVSTANKDACNIALKPAAGKIFLSKVDFWKADYDYEKMKLKHDRKMYPPRIKVTIQINSDSPYFIVDFKFKGCRDADEDSLNMQLILPTSSFSSASSTASTLSSGISIIFNMRSLSVINWTDSKGKNQKIKVIQMIQNRWRQIGLLLGIGYEELEAIGRRRENADDCCVDVLNRWMTNGSRDYLPSWEGLIKLLEDDLFAELARQLRSLI